MPRTAATKGAAATADDDEESYGRGGAAASFAAAPGNAPPPPPQPPPSSSSRTTATTNTATSSAKKQHDGHPVPHSSSFRGGENENDDEDHRQRRRLRSAGTDDAAGAEGAAAPAAAVAVVVQRRPTRGPIQNPVVWSSAVLCGIAAGVAQAGAFNPYDRALYLSVRDRRPFLDRANWTAPYAGFWQSLGGRALAGGMYYPVEHYFLRLLNRPGESSPRANLVAGIAAGACNAVAINPISVVKYRTWGRRAGRDDGGSSGGWWKEASAVLRDGSGSARPFFNGLAPTVARDVVFGGAYTGCRLQVQWYADLSPDRQWQGNLAAAGFATVLASPFNYARNVQYAARSDRPPPGTVRILRQLALEVGQAGATWPRRLRLLQQRLRIGWGTLRVALGMSFAHSVYDALQKKVQPY